MNLLAENIADSRRHLTDYEIQVQDLQPGMPRWDEACNGREVLAEWRFAAASADFRDRLAAGAQSEDPG